MLEAKILPKDAPAAAEGEEEEKVTYELTTRQYLQAKEFPIASIR